MGDIVEITEIVQQGGNPLNSFVLVFAYIFLIVTVVKYLYSGFMVLYKKKHGIESKEENTEKLIQELYKSINDLKDVHEKDVTKLSQKENNDIKQIKESIDRLTTSVQETNDRIKTVSERDKRTNQAVLRSDIIRIYNELEENHWKMAPISKENLDHLFESYFENGGNGLIKDIKKDYDAHVNVDYSIL